MKSYLRLTALIVAIVLALGLAARPTAAVVSPNGSYTADEAGVLSEKTKDYITERNDNLEENCSGAQICVVVLDSIGSERIENYAASLFEKWQIGRSGEDNGVLLLMVVGNKDYYILPGSGLASAFPTKTISDIIRNNLEPFFNDGDYDGAAKEAFRKLNVVVCRF
ncbi:MAG: TPM domain-containing protein, partial [Clostridia bacterium]|nr:TPM domain-containing protein [Clostridia bacterium]